MFYLNDTPKMVHCSTGYGTGAGLCGWNCYHSFHAYIEGMPRAYSQEMLDDYKEAKYEYEGKMYTDYECKQMMRYQERRIRETKRTLSGLNAGIEGATSDSLKKQLKDEFEKKSVLLKSQEAQLKDICYKTGRRYESARTQVHAVISKGKIVGFNKSVSQKAVWGAKRVANLKKNDIINSKIRTTFIRRNNAKGNANAILQFDVKLNNRQARVLDCLKTYDSRVIVKKSDINMRDLSALTAKTGVEFAMFTCGSRRMIIRGNHQMVNVGLDDAKKLAEIGYKFSGHTHPGIDYNVLMPSDDDYKILKVFNQKFSATYNSKGQYNIYEREEKL